MNPDPPPTPGLVTIVLPAKNEAAAIGQTLRSIPRSTLQAMGFDTEVFVLDGHSEDATRQIAQRWGATVVPDREPGKGAAFRNALSLYRGQYGIMLDADGTYPADSIPRMLGPLLRGEADLVMGHRLLQPGSMKPVHLVANATLSMVASLLYQRVCPDICTGMWAFRLDALRALPLRSRRFGLEAEMFAYASRLGLRVTIVRVDYLRRRGAAKLSFGHDGLRIVRRLMRSRLLPLDRHAGAPHSGLPLQPSNRTLDIIHGNPIHSRREPQ